MMHWISCSVAGCRMSIGALTRGVWLGGCCISDVISPNGFLNSRNLADKKITEPFRQDVDWLPWQGHGLVSAKESVDNIKQFLSVISVDQFGLVVHFDLSDQIIYVVTPLHEDVTMDGMPCFSPESISYASELLGFSYISDVSLSLRADCERLRRQRGALVENR